MNEACHQAFGSLFQAAEIVYQNKSARLAHRVVSLCQRLFGHNLEIQLVLAQLSCRYGDLSDARKRFSSAVTAADRICQHGKCLQRRDGVYQLLVAAKTAYGMCMMEARDFKAAAAKFRGALALDSTLDAVAWHLGLACDYGRDWQGAVEAYQLWLRIHRERATPVAIPARPPGKLVVAIFCLARVENMPNGWGPSSLKQTGIGGSEEAVILLSHELAALGMHVEVYAHPPADEIGFDDRGVAWLPVHAYSPHTHPPHVFVSWRGYALSTYGGSHALNFLWLHDRVIPQLLPPAMLSRLHGILVLSRHHATQLPAHAQEKAVPTRNGLERSFFRDGPNTHNIFIFASHPERGLEQLLTAWPVIRAGVEGAVLKVFHGFPAHYGEGGAPAEELQRMRRLKASVDAMLHQPGVEYGGMVNQTALANAYAGAGFWLYPTSMAETSCISAMKAMANGAIPITSRFSPSGLTETTGKFDVGPEPPPEGVTLQSSPRHLQQWAEAVVAAAKRGEDVHVWRREMKEWARKRYSWQGVAEDWRALFRERLDQESQPLL